MRTNQQKDSQQRGLNKSQEVCIPEEELSFAFSCSGGPGGQNVNKRETKVRLTFDILASRALTLEQKTIMLRSPLMKSLIHDDAVIVMTCQIHRTQGQNRQECTKMLHELLEEILTPEKERILGGKPPSLGYPPSEHRKRQERRAQERLRRALKAASQEHDGSLE